MAGWHHLYNEHELGQTSGDGEGQGGLVCCSPWGHKESDTADLLQALALFACLLDARPYMPAVVLYYCTFQGIVLDYKCFIFCVF